MRILCFLLSCILAIALHAQHILVFSKTNGFRHESIPAGRTALEKIAQNLKMQISFSEDSLIYETKKFNETDVLIFLNTSGDILNEQQQNFIEDFVSNGGGLIGIHGASATEYDWKWYGKVLGTYFLNHPEIQEAELRVADHAHPTTSMLPNSWRKRDEWYNFRNNLSEEFRVLITINEQSYAGGTMGAFHPVSWCREYKKGKVFYTSMGHTSETYSESGFLMHLTAAIKWAAKKQ